MHTTDIHMSRNNSSTCISDSQQEERTTKSTIRPVTPLANVETAKALEDAETFPMALRGYIKHGTTSLVLRTLFGTKH
jgi:hypothetical protein